MRAFRRASIHRDFFYLAAPSLVEISPLTLVLVTLSPFRVSKLPTINHDDEPSSNLFTGFSNCETPTRYHRRLTVQTLLSAEAVRGRLSLDATHETTRLPWKRSSINHTAFSDPRVPDFPCPRFFAPSSLGGSSPDSPRDAIRGETNEGRAVTRKRIVKYDNLSMRGCRIT